jgi:hypothetical protein
MTDKMNMTLINLAPFGESICYLVMIGLVLVV